MPVPSGGTRRLLEQGGTPGPRIDGRTAAGYNSPVPSSTLFEAAFVGAERLLWGFIFHTVTARKTQAQSAQEVPR